MIAPTAPAGVLREAHLAGGAGRADRHRHRCADRAGRCTHACAPGSKRHGHRRAAPAGRRASLEGDRAARAFLVALVVMLIVRGRARLMAMHTAVIDTALQLTTALVLVRLGRVPAAPVRSAATAGSAPGKRASRFILWLHRSASSCSAGSTPPRARSTAST